MIPKDVWTKNITDSLKEIASEEYQIKGWIKNEIHEYCNFFETSSRVFNDVHVEEFLEHAKDFGFSDIQIKKIDLAFKAFENFSDKYSGFEDPNIIVNDSEFLKVRKLAKEALESMGIKHYLDPSKQIFKDMLLYRIYWLSDTTYQHRAWITEKRGKTNAFEECMNDFFITAKASMVILNYKDHEITDDQVIKIKELYDHLEKYRDQAKAEQDLQKILNDPKWHKIQNLAKEIVTLFNFKP